MDFSNEIKSHGHIGKDTAFVKKCIVLLYESFEELQMNITAIVRKPYILPDMAPPSHSLIF